MIAGDLRTFCLSDLLQWADASRAAGILTIERSGVSTWVRIADRDVVLVSPAPERVFGAGQAAGPSRASRADVTAVDRLIDLFMEDGGHFHFGDTEEREDGVALRISVRVLVMEGLRCLDEWPRLQKTFPDDNAVLQRTANAAPPELSPILEALLATSAQRPSLAEARLTLGLSRPALLRRAGELQAMGLVEVEGSRAGADPVAHLIGQALTLIAEQQFDEAGIVFAALLSADPTDARVRRLLHAAEREHIAALYTELDPLSVVLLVDNSATSSRRLSHADREVADRINGRWDVASLVLSSPLREVETLKSIRKLVKLGIAELSRRV